MSIIQRSSKSIHVNYLYGSMQRTLRCYLEKQFANNLITICQKQKQSAFRSKTTTENNLLIDQKQKQNNLEIPKLWQVWLLYQFHTICNMCTMTKMRCDTPVSISLYREMDVMLLYQFHFTQFAIFVPCLKWDAMRYTCFNFDN